MPEETRRVAAITGRVTDAGTGLPIPGARIEIVNGPAEFLAWLAALSGDPDWERRPSRLDRAAVLALEARPVLVNGPFGSHAASVAGVSATSTDRMVNRPAEARSSSSSRVPW